MSGAMSDTLSYLVWAIGALVLLYVAYLVGMWVQFMVLMA